jgi:hypothetical protein
VENGPRNYRVEVSPDDAGGGITPGVEPHAAQLNVWNVPSAIVAGERFRVSVGVRCSAGCDLSGQSLGIFDQTGAEVGTVRLGREVWPGADALFFSEVEAQAPRAPGSHRWEIRTGHWVLKLPHAAGSLPMTLRVVRPPDCEVTVKVVDRESQAPIQGARVVMHPFRAVTDDRGIAKVKVTRGPYDILVSGSKYVPVCTSVEVTADLITRAELDADSGGEIPE